MDGRLLRNFFSLFFTPVLSRSDEVCFNFEPLKTVKNTVSGSAGLQWTYRSICAVLMVSLTDGASVDWSGLFCVGSGSLSGGRSVSVKVLRTV